LLVWVQWRQTPLDDPGMSSLPLILALDLGTSSFRSMLFRADGRAVRGSLQAIAVPETAIGVMDPLLAAESVEELIDASSRQAAAMQLPIAIVAMSCFWHSLLGVSRSGEPVTPVYLWSDPRSAPDAADLRAELDCATVQTRTGSSLHPVFWPAKLRWLRRTSPDLWREADAWLSFGDYLYVRWLGRRQTSLSMASATGLMDQARMDWDDELLRASHLNAKTLPRIVSQPASGATLARGLDARWPALQSALWLPAVGDGACSNLGVGAVLPDRWAVTVGTSAAVRAVLRDLPTRLPAGLWQYRIDAERMVLGGALNNGGNVYEWLRQMLRLPAAAALEEELRERSWGNHRLTVDPSIFGERSPDWPLDASASIAGITARTSTVDIAQALLEAVAQRIAEIAGLMESALGPPTSIVATGGAMVRSAAWRGMLEHALGRPVAASKVRESSLRGAAQLAVEHLETGGNVAS
jgi:gluconokinase